jgi:large conductance mechanosensitive channel
MRFVREFKEFAIKGNVIELAIGVIIGAAFSKIVSSLVDDIIMPPISYLTQEVNFKELKIVLKDKIIDAVTGHVVYADVSIKIGNFIQTVFDFMIITLIIYLMVKGINKVRNKEISTTELHISGEEKLLTEIRDLLKNQQALHKNSAIS